MASSNKRITLMWVVVRVDVRRPDRDVLAHRVLQFVSFGVFVFCVCLRCWCTCGCVLAANSNACAREACARPEQQRKCTKRRGPHALSVRVRPLTLSALNKARFPFPFCLSACVGATAAQRLCPLFVRCPARPLIRRCVNALFACVVCVFCFCVVLCCDCGAWWCSIMPSTTTTTTTRGNGGQSLCAHQNLTPHLQPLLPLLLLLTHCQCPAPPLPALPCQPSTHHHHPSHTTHLRFTAQQTCSTNQQSTPATTARSLPILRCLQVHGRKDQR